MRSGEPPRDTGNGVLGNFIRSAIHLAGTSFAGFEVAPLGVEAGGRDGIADT